MTNTYEAETTTVPGPTEGPAEFGRLKKLVLDGHDARARWRKEATMDFEYVAGHQWNETDKAQLAEENRPVVTFNRVEPLIEAVCGLEQNNRQKVMYLPRTEGDVEPDEALTDAVTWVRDETQSEDEESEAFRDLATCGEGWTETRMDYDDEQTGKVSQEKIDPLEMGVNKGACKANYSDARLMYRVRTVSVDDARTLLGDDTLEPAQMHAAWMTEQEIPSDGGEAFKRDYPSQTRDGLSERGRTDATEVRLVQVQWWEWEDAVMVGIEGQPTPKTMSPEEFDVFAQRASVMAAAGDTRAPVYKSARTRKKCFYEAFLGNMVIGKRKLPLGRFQFEAMTAKWDRKQKCFYGLVRALRDPQMWANKWLSQTMHMVNTNAKGGLMVEADAFVNIRKAEKDWSDPAKFVVMKSGALTKNKVKERVPPPLPQGLSELLQFALSSMRDVTGVNLELLGQADREQAASLEMQRRQAAVTILATLFSSLRRYRKRQGRLFLHFMKLLPPGTLYPVLRQDQWRWVPIMMTEDAERYHIIFDEGPSTPDQKQAVWALTTELLRSGIPFPPPVLVKMLKYSPYPAHVVKEISDAMGLGKTLPPEILQQKLQQAEQALQVMEQRLQEAMAEAQTENDKIAVQKMLAEVQQFRAQTERDKVYFEAAGGQSEHLLDTVDAAIRVGEAEVGTPATPGSETSPGSPAQPGADMSEVKQLLAAILERLVPFEPPTNQPEPQGV